MPAADGYFTPDEIVADALYELNEETPSAEVGAWALNKYRALYATMQDEYGADWPFAMCPAKAHQGVVAILAARCAGRVRGVDRMTAEAEERVGWRQYLTATAVPESARPTPGEYF